MNISELNGAELKALIAQHDRVIKDVTDAIAQARMKRKCMMIEGASETAIVPAPDSETPKLILCGDCRG